MNSYADGAILIFSACGYGFGDQVLALEKKVSLWVLC